MGFSKEGSGFDRFQSSARIAAAQKGHHPEVTSRVPFCCRGPGTLLGFSCTNTKFRTERHTDPPQNPALLVERKRRGKFAACLRENSFVEMQQAGPHIGA
jgi:hypothetical protein